jgi:hypothetical protein
MQQMRMPADTTYQRKKIIGNDTYLNGTPLCMNEEI